MIFMPNIFYPVRLDQQVQIHTVTTFAILQRYFQDKQGRLDDVIQLVCESGELQSLRALLGVIYSDGHAFSYEPPIDRLKLKDPRDERIKFYHVSWMSKKQIREFEHY